MRALVNQLNIDENGEAENFIEKYNQQINIKH